MSKRLSKRRSKKLSKKQIDFVGWSNGIIDKASDDLLRSMRIERTKKKNKEKGKKAKKKLRRSA